MILSWEEGCFFSFVSELEARVAEAFIMAYQPGDWLTSAAFGRLWLFSRCHSFFAFEPS